MKKRGQITLFIILGMLILLGVAIFIFLREKEIIFQPEIIVPTEIEPIKRYVDACVLTLATDAIERIGIQGGYYNVPRDILNERTSYLDYGLGMYAIPYWYFEGELRIPSFNFIADEVVTHVEMNLQNCTNRFEPFSGMYDITEEPPKAELVINDNDMTMIIDYPLRIDQKNANKRTRLEKFSVKIPADLKGAWDLANKTMHAEISNYLLENLTMSIITSDPEQIPFTGMDFECEFNNWRVSEIQTLTEQLMQTNLPRVRVKNTDYPPFEREEEFYESFRDYTFMDSMESLSEGNEPPIVLADSVSDWYEYFKMFFDVKSESPNLRIAFMYQPEWEMEMIVQPSEGDRLLPRKFPGAGMLSFMCFQVYHYTYNIRYPVLVRIIDPDAFFGKGFTFQYVVPVIIQNNEGSRDIFRVANFDGYRTTYEFCDPSQNFGNDVFTITARGMDEDGYPDQPIHDVNITYRCLNRVCDNLAMTGFGGKVETTLPEGCGNPTLIGKKDGYLDGYATAVSTDVVIQMDKVRRFNWTVMKYVYESGTGAFIGTEPLEDYENATFFIEKLDKKQDMILNYPPIDENFTQELELRQEGADYRIEAVLYRQGLDDIEPVGGYYIKNITFNYDYFTDTQNVVLPVIDYRPQPVSEEENFDMWTYIFDSRYNETVRPTFS